MKSTFKILFYLKRDRMKSNGKVPIMCRITINCEAARFNTKLEINPDLWDTRNAKAIGKSNEAIEVNDLLERTSGSLRRIQRELWEKGENVTSEKIKNIYTGFSSKNETLLKLFEEHNQEIEQLVNISKSKATLQKYKVTCRHLKEFMELKYKISDIALREIDHKFICDFETYLRSQCSCNSNTTGKFMRFVKKIIIRAINQGLISADPFANYKIQIKKVDRGYLTQQELDTIIYKEFPTQRLEQVRDVFVFSCFCGLAYIDVRNLKVSDIQISFDNKMWIIKNRQKTDIQSRIPLLDIPKSIIEKYHSKKLDNTSLQEGIPGWNKFPNERLLPVLSNQKVNSYLKEIADICGISKNFTFHLARHTFATTVTIVPPKIWTGLRIRKK